MVCVATIRNEDAAKAKAAKDAAKAAEDASQAKAAKDTFKVPTETWIKVGFLLGCVAVGAGAGAVVVVLTSPVSTPAAATLLAVKAAVPLVARMTPMLLVA